MNDNDEAIVHIVARIAALESDVEKLKTLLEKVMPYLAGATAFIAWERDGRG